MTDPIPAHEYKSEEDPRLYKSAKTQRGPLWDDWIEEYNNNPGKTPIMCAYKLCKVEFRYWGMQSKIERFIHDVGELKVPDVPAFLKKKNVILLIPYLVTVLARVYCSATVFH